MSGPKQNQSPQVRFQPRGCATRGAKTALSQLSKNERPKFALLRLHAPGRLSGNQAEFIGHAKTFAAVTGENPNPDPDPDTDPNPDPNPHPYPNPRSFRVQLPALPARTVPGCTNVDFFFSTLQRGIRLIKVGKRCLPFFCAARGSATRPAAHS